MLNCTGVKNHYELNDTEFEQQFDALELDNSLFNHEAHIRLAWIHITQYGVEKAVLNLRKQILSFAKHVNEEAIYNDELTVISIKVVHSFMLKSTKNTFKEFVAEFPELTTNFKEIINRH